MSGTRARAATTIPSTLTLANRRPAEGGADGDGRRRRQDTAAINLGQGVFTDRGRRSGGGGANRGATDALVLDESPVGTEEDGDSDPAGLATVTANFADNFVTSVDYGSDGPGTAALRAGSDRFERGVGSVCAWRERRAGRLDRAEPGCAWRRHHRHGRRRRRTEYFRISINRGDGRGDVQPEHATSGTPTPAATTIPSTLTLANADRCCRWCRR